MIIVNFILKYKKFRMVEGYKYFLKILKILYFYIPNRVGDVTIEQHLINSVKNSLSYPNSFLDNNKN